MTRDFRAIWSTFAFSAIVAGCASSPPVIDSNGLISRENSVQFTQFKSSFDRSNLLALQVIEGRMDPKDPQVQRSYANMFDTGAHLADANCADYFRSTGRDQKWLLVSKDLVAFGGTLGTALSVAAGAASGITTGLSIATATAYNGLDVYQRNFLFGADNIQSVESLVQRAESAHTQKTMELSTKIGWSGFGEVANSIMDHQEICSPAYILMLTRSAIRYGNVQAETGNASSKRVDVNVVPTPYLGQGVRNSAVTAAVSNGPGSMVQSGRVIPAEVPPIVRPLPSNIAEKVTALRRQLRRLAGAQNGLENLRKIADKLSVSDKVGTTPLSTGELRDVILARMQAAISSNDPDTAAEQYQQFLTNVKSANVELPK